LTAGVCTLPPPTRKENTIKANRQTDVYYLTIAGANPHEIASNMGEPDSPFYDEVARPGVSQHIIVDGQLVGGIVEVWADEHLTTAQERALAACPHVIDVRHVYP